MCTYVCVCQAHLHNCRELPSHRRVQYARESVSEPLANWRARSNKQQQNKKNENKVNKNQISMCTYAYTYTSMYIDKEEKSQFINGKRKYCMHKYKDGYCNCCCFSY